MKKLLIVVDFQNDFVDGTLGFNHAKTLEKRIVELIKEYKENGDDLIYTLDTHQTNYMETEEGRHLPVVHCIEGTHGWELYGEVKDLLKDDLCFKKETFPSLDLANYLKDKEYESVLLVGLVSHICVLSNAIMVKAALPNTPISIDLSATSSAFSDTHEKSIDVLKSMHIEMINE